MGGGDPSNEEMILKWGGGGGFDTPLRTMLLSIYERVGMVRNSLDCN